MERYTFNPLTKELTPIPPEQDGNYSPRSRMNGGHVVALTIQEAADLDAAELQNELDGIVASKTSELEAAYVAATENGFTSSATGQPLLYKSTPDAQRDLIGIAACRRPRNVWCSADGGVTWSMVQHTSVEIEDVINAGADTKENAFTNLVSKQAIIESVLTGAGTNAEKIAAINAIVW